MSHTAKNEEDNSIKWTTEQYTKNVKNVNAETEQKRCATRDSLLTNSHQSLNTVTLEDDAAAGSDVRGDTLEVNTDGRPPRSSSAGRRKLRKKKKERHSGQPGHSSNPDSGVESDRAHRVRKLRKKKRKYVRTDADRDPEMEPPRQGFCSDLPPLHPSFLQNQVPDNFSNRLWFGDTSVVDNGTQKENLRLDLSELEDAESSEVSDKSRINKTPQKQAAYDIFTIGSPPLSNCDPERTKYVKNQSNIDSTCAKRVPTDTKKKRFGLKRTSSKVSVTNSLTASPRSSRLELDKSARTQRDPEVGKDDGSDTPQTFPEPLKFCKLLARFPITCFCEYTLFV